jgi:hypothetical protein
MNGTQRITKALNAEGWPTVEVAYERLQEQVETGWFSGGWSVVATNDKGECWAAQEPTLAEMLQRIHDESCVGV